MKIKQTKPKIQTILEFQLPVWKEHRLSEGRQTFPDLEAVVELQLNFVTILISSSD